MEIYLDNAASTAIDPRVLNTYVDASLRFFGNSSNIKHQHGRAAKKALEAARNKIGRYLELDPRGIIFTSGATEANNLALRGLACLKNKCSILISSIEHACVDESVKLLLKRGLSVGVIPTLPNGQTDIAALATSIKKSRNLRLISNISVNNETGVIQPLPQIIKLARENKALIHTDAVQAIGKLSTKLLKYVDLVSISGHKLNGPKGIGLLWVNPKLKINPLLVGGGQEHGIRSGTSPVPSIIAFAKAIEIAVTDPGWLLNIGKDMRALEKRIIKSIPGVHINGVDAARVQSISNMSFSLREPLIGHLQGIAVSSGAACSCPKLTPSKVLLSMGLSEDLAKNCLRISACRTTTPQDIRTAGDIIIQAAQKLL
jgi:cysteine desulfurase